MGIRPAGLILLLLLLCTPLYAGMDENHYTLEDGDTLHKGRGALLLLGGYPRSGLAFSAAPWKYVNVGFRMEMEYDPSFDLAVPFKFQMLESDNERLNLALTLAPSFYALFLEDDYDVSFRLKPGVAAGWRFYRGLTYFLSAEYMAVFPVSAKAEWAHYPLLGTGFEIPLPRHVNLIFKGLVEFRDYAPDAFVYGGYFGIAVGLWK